MADHPGCGLLHRRVARRGRSRGGPPVPCRRPWSAERPLGRHLFRPGNPYPRGSAGRSPSSCARKRASTGHTRGLDPRLCRDDDVLIGERLAEGLDPRLRGDDGPRQSDLCPVDRCGRGSGAPPIWLTQTDTICRTVPYLVCPRASPVYSTISVRRVVHGERGDPVLGGHRGVTIWTPRSDRPGFAVS